MNSRCKKYKGLYSEVIDYSKNFKIGHAQHSILEPGEFKGELCQVISEDVIVCKIQSNRTMLEMGRTLNNFTVFLLPGNLEQDLTWRNQRLTGKRIGLLKSQMSHIAIIPPDFSGTPIGLNNDFLKKLIIESNFDKNIYQLIQKTDIVELKVDEAIRLQSMIKELCESDFPDEKKLNKELPNLLLEALVEKSGNINIKLPNSKEMIFNGALQYINDHLMDIISTKTLCKNIKISERNLRYKFDELTGLSPMKFIKYLRLNRVRKEIKNSDHKANISLIASKWGFNHSGQFATDYKNLFGEYPSDTLKNIYQNESIK